MGRLLVFVRDGYYHARGTVRHAGVKRRVRKSLDISFLRETLDQALVAARTLEEQVRAELGAGVVHLSFAEVALAFMAARPKDQPLGATDIAVIKEMASTFGTRILRDIAPAEFIKFVEDRQAGNSASTRERFLNTVCAFLTNAVSRGQYAEMPKFKRDKAARNPSRRKRRKVAHVRPFLLSLLLESSHIAMAAQLCVEAATGARVSSVLFGCSLDDLVMVPGAMKITYHDTKNGDDVVAALPESVRSLLEKYLAWRELQVRARRVSAAGDAPLFLTPRGRPYRSNPDYTGTRNKTAFNATKRRAAALLEARASERIASSEAAGDASGIERLRKMLAEDRNILTAITQHWLRHKLATDLGRVDLRAAMRQGGWRDLRSVQGYLIDDAEFQRAAVEDRTLFDTNLAREGSSDKRK